ncbi:hypothetical protein SLE2022_161660 [Rubroshorea leprosula]
MFPNYHSSLNSPFLIDLNEDLPHHDDQIFSLKSQDSSSSSSLSGPSFFNPTQQHGGYFVQEPQRHKEEDKVLVEEGRSCEGESTLKFSIWKKEDKQENNNQSDHGSMKWMSSKMRIMRKMMKSSDHRDLSSNPRLKYEDKKPSPLLETDNSSSSSHINSNNTIRVCSDCNTTKTPLWRSGPKGPKSLCNACGIRQRKARRAMAAAAAAAAANDTDVPAETTSVKGKVQHKDKRTSNGLKKKHKIMPSQAQQGRKKLCFEELRIILSQKYSAFHGVFPQDEKEAAILLMALSYGLVCG